MRRRVRVHPTSVRGGGGGGFFFGRLLFGSSGYVLYRIVGIDTMEIYWWSWSEVGCGTGSRFVVYLNVLC